MTDAVRKYEISPVHTIIVWGRDMKVVPKSLADAAIAELKAKLAAAEERVTEFIEGSPLDVADHLVSAYQYEAERWEWVARLFNRMLTNSTGYDQLPAALDRFETQERWDHAADHWTETQP